MKIFYVVFLVAFVAFLSCGDKKETKFDLAQQVIDEAINVVGGDQFKSAIIDFDFRDRHYRAMRDRWKFKFERIWKDSVNNYRDLISNDGYQRYINDSLVKVPDTMMAKYSRSINAVHYFSILPYGLNDKAVNKSYLDEVEINGKPYHKIKVTFNKDGGGEDYEDIFVYWINKNTYEVDYFGYYYDQGPDDRGVRFREAYNRRTVNGLSFTDYNNFKSDDDNVSVYSLDSLFVANQLKLLSKIELENINVNLLSKADQ